MTSRPTTFAEAAAGARPRTADEAPAPPSPPGAPATSFSGNTVVDPRDGEVLDLASAATDQLADLVLECQRRERDLQAGRRAAEDELRGRLEREGRRVAVVGDYELSLDSGRARAWDADDLEATVRDLLDRGVLDATWTAGLIKRETKVDGRAAQRLLGMLSGPPKAAVEACFKWESKGRQRVQITRVPDLAEALSRGPA